MSSVPAWPPTVHSATPVVMSYLVNESRRRELTIAYGPSCSTCAWLMSSKMLGGATYVSRTSPVTASTR